VWFQRGHLLWGLSTKPASVGEKIPVVLWFDNPSDTQQGITECGDIDYFWAREIELLDSAGKPVLSHAQYGICFSNGSIFLPPHTCLHGSFAAYSIMLPTGGVVSSQHFTKDISRYYTLPPGRYSLAPIGAREPEPSSGRTVAQRWTLPITVLDR
jgi:hypothetical protein